MTRQRRRQRPAADGAGLPDGIERRHAEETRGWRRYASVLALAILTVIALAALAGLLGGRDHSRTARTEAASLDVFGPGLIRTGEFFEMRFRIEAAQALSDAVIAVDEGIWRDITVNTMIPAATEESSEDGQFRFSLGEIPAGGRHLFKVDLQINPDFFGINAGDVQLLDGDEVVAEVRYELGVLP